MFILDEVEVFGKLEVCHKRKWDLSLNRILDRITKTAAITSQKQMREACS